jgi:hypothetical protein
MIGYSIFRPQTTAAIALRPSIDLSVGKLILRSSTVTRFKELLHVAYV